MIVVDCTVLFKLAIDTDEAPRLEKLRLMDPDWRAPSFWEIEFASVVRKYERAGLLPETEGDRCCEFAFEILADGSHHLPLHRILETSRRTGCSVYDSQYVALAEDLRTLLYTHDEEILARCPRLARRP